MCVLLDEMVTRALAAIEMASSSCVRIITDTLLPRSETDFNIRRQRAQSFAGNAQRASAVCGVSRLHIDVNLSVH